MTNETKDALPVDLRRRKPTKRQRDRLAVIVAASQEEVRLLNEQAEREARAAGPPGAGVHVERGWVVHPDDRGALKSRRGRAR